MINIKVTNPFYDKTYEINSSNDDEQIKSFKAALDFGYPISFTDKENINVFISYNKFASVEIWKTEE